MKTATLVTAPRAVQYFAAHLDEANSVAADCRIGTVQADECANADMALQQDAKKRFKRFPGN